MWVLLDPAVPCDKITKYTVGPTNLQHSVVLYLLTLVSRIYYPRAM